MFKLISWGIASACAVLLTGCATVGEPSDGDIRSAIETTVQQNHDSMNEMVQQQPQTAQIADAFRLKLHGVDKVACTVDGDKAYVCNVKVDVESGITGRAQNTVPLRMVRDNHGWHMVQGT